MKTARPGDLAWASEGRTMWLVHTMDEGTVIRESTWGFDRDERKRYSVGSRQAIAANGLLPIEPDVVLTDEELVFVTKCQLLYPERV